MAKGTLIAAMNIGQAAEDEFHDWYDTEHLPERQRVPAFLVCQRWIGADDRISGETLSPWSKRVTGKVERLMRFEGDQILPGDHLGRRSPATTDEATWDNLPQMLALAKHPNVAIKATGAPSYSSEAYPFRDIHDKLRRIFDAAGPRGAGGSTA
jgi:hypothetical protein